jgi:uncharacterized protein
MDPTSQHSPRPPLEVRGARASTVIVQRIATDAGDAFLAWQRCISDAAAEFPGYQTTEIYPPSREQEEWVIVIHFDDAKTLQVWLDSPKRAAWVAKLPGDSRDFRQKMLPSGFGPWFANLDMDGAPLPGWKMSLTVLFGLYPAVMLLNLFLSPLTKGFGMAVSSLIGCAAGVSFLQWLGMPVLNRLLHSWLRANGKEQRALSLLGLVLVLAALGLMAFLFSLVPPS